MRKKKITHFCTNGLSSTINILGRLKIREENILSMKIKANDIDVIDAKRFDSFSSVIINCKKKCCCFNEKPNNTRLKLKTLVKFV